MKALCALSLAATLACATGSSSNGASAGGSTNVDAQSCSPMILAVARRGTAVYDRPDAAVSARTARLDEDTPVCASTDSKGFGFRLVKLANGKSGYVEESNLSN
jgi:hypothetical protein